MTLNPIHTIHPIHRTATAALASRSDADGRSRLSGNPPRFAAVAAAATAAVAMLVGSLGMTPAVAQPQLTPAIATADGEAPRYGRHGGHGGRPAGGSGAAMGGHGMGMMGLPPMHGRMLDRVGATDEQKAQIEQIMQSARADLKAQRDAGASTREQARALFAQPNIDARTAETLRQQLMAQHDQASQRMTQAMVEASRVLTVEQRQALVQQTEQRRALMEQHRSERMERGQRSERMERAPRGERRPMSGSAGGTI